MGPNKGSLNWKLENRHRYSDMPPSALGFESGYVGVFDPVFSTNRIDLPTCTGNNILQLVNGPQLQDFSM